MRSNVIVLAFALFASAPTFAQAPEQLLEPTPILDAGPAPPAPTPRFSSELLDPGAQTRFHLITRFTLGDGDSVVSSQSAWAYEARAYVRLLDGFSVALALPIGLHAPAGSDTLFLGNLAVGVAFGAPMAAGDMKLRVGGGVDVYLPTAPKSTSGDVFAAESLVAAIRSYEPQLYISQLMSFRGRGHADVTIGTFIGELELGLVPAFTTESQARFVMLFSAAARASIEATPEIEPFFEIARTVQIAGDGDIAPPLLLTPGVRFHFGEVLDPALFVSFNFVEASAVIVGVDLAAAVRSGPGRKPRAENRDDNSDYLPDF